ncbi:MAG TPA: isoprenylcysteine carboxylmethyltransferase family protein [Bryobacteraceae bacterium]|jgi:protein-S-isoprenylcysteine O-methyltransferase Ste14|nr:isoprenylcysteine carboxylmethyltransferase family protein [Bryobacteraceae bacterium]
MVVRAEISILAVEWVLFYTYWLVAALRAKRNVGWKRGSQLFRILVFVTVITLLKGVPGLRHLMTILPGPAARAAGLFICALGLAFAVWARRYLGRNWGMPMSVKEDPELVTSGPYRYVRHPIYAGLLLALLGSALVSGALWLMIFAILGGYFVLAARAEERLMLRQFPEQYAAYRARTKVMIPFVY